MSIERFEDINAWKNAKEMTLLLYEEMKGNNDYGFRNQLLRASVSVMNNIAEGFERQTKNLSSFCIWQKEAAEKLEVCCTLPKS